jgi:predicted O-methyltransferase YrrM
MGQERWTAVDSYITSSLVGPDGALDETLKESAAAGLPAIAVSPPQGKLLYLLARSIGASSILELGTLGGYSTIWLARALAPGGQVITLEANPSYAELAITNIERAGLSAVVELRLGRALETLAELDAEDRGPFDLVFIDADKQSTPDYFAWALEHSHPGTLIVADNVIRDGAVIDPDSHDPVVEGARRFHELLETESRVSATTIQTVGLKGYDGFTLALVDGE